MPDAGGQTVEELMVIMRGDISGLTASFESVIAAASGVHAKVQEHAQGMSEAFGGLKDMVLELAAAIGITLGAEALEEFIKSGIEATATMAELSKRMNVSMESLYELKLVAADSGTDFEALSQGMERLQRYIGEMAPKAADAQGAFKDLGIDAKDLIHLAPDEAFRKIADAMAGLSSQATRSHAGVELFGRGYAQLNAIMKQGSVAFDEAAEEAKKLGVGMNGIDGARAEMAVDNFKKLRIVLEQTKETIAAQLTPAIVALSGYIIKAAEDSGGFRTKIVDGVQTAITWIGYLGDAIQTIRRVFEPVVIVMAAGLIATLAEWRALATVIVTVGRVFGSVCDVFVNGWIVVKDAFKDPWSTLKAATAEMLTTVGDALSKLLGIAETTFRALGQGTIADTFKIAADGIMLSAGIAADGIKKTIADPAIVKHMDDLKSSIVGIGTSLTSLGKGNEFIEGIDSAIAQVAAFIKTSAGDMKKDWESPWAHTAIDSWFAKVKAYVDQYAAMKSKTENLDKDQKDASYDSSDQLKKQIDAFAAKLNQERILENQSYLASVAETKSEFEKTKVDQATQDAILEDMKRQHEGNLANIHMTEREKIQAWDRRTDAEQIKFSGDMLGQLATLSSSHNKTIFEIGKAARMGQIVADTAAGIMQQYATLPFPVAVATSAIIAAVGAVQFAAAAGATMGGGGGAGGGGGGGGGRDPTAAASPTGPGAYTNGVQGGARSGQTVALSVAPGLYSRNDLLSLHNQLAGLVADGATLGGQR